MSENKSSDLDNSMIEQFASDADQIFQSLENTLLSLQKNPDQPELLQGAYRLMHSFKGNCSLMEYHDLETLGHSLESILAVYRNNTETISQDVTSVCLSSIDCLRTGVEFPLPPLYK